MLDENSSIDPADGQKRTAISIVVHPDLLDAVDFLARQQNRSRSNMIEQLIQHGFVAEASGRRLGK